ncbi:Histone-lysine N-methyltransferase 2A like protein [Argiope bruennichi]|uniref:Histone-lysine N-methyltransferase trithorax n=1 Tax=Argiope bruennichi TaxID=94029 RepID=A0A8T0EJY4_ARGBR|nr:Histone-lysine N-methyltransferase 2A like protein [Argiope bruennichi]
MARLRFPGRPGQRIGKNYVKYVYDDVKLNAEICHPVFHKIEVGLKLFHDLFGYSDEEEDFEGFTLEDIAQAEATVANKSKQKEAIRRFLDSSNEFSSPPTSEIDRLLSSSDSDTSTYSVRRERGMRNIVRKSYDKMIKEGLSKSNVHSNNTVYVDKTPQSSKPKPFARQNISLEARFRSELPVEQSNPVNIYKSKSDNQIDTNLPSDNKASGKTSIVRHLLEKAKHQVKTRRRRRRTMRPTVQRKFQNRYIYPSKCKYSNLRKKLSTVEEDRSPKNKLRKKSFEHPVSKNDLGPESNSSVKLERETLKDKSKRSFPRRKRFILPSMSARSSRKIIPRKRYLDEYELPLKKTVDEDSQCSRSSLSGSSETISAMDGGSSPEDTQMEDSRYSKKLQKKVGLLDRPLVVEGKRQWKPSLKVQMKLSEMNYEYPFGLKKNDDSSGTGTSSGSFKDIIKPDMVSKYAEKMAQKPKDRPFKILESFKKSSSHSVKSEPEKAEDSSDNMDDDKKPEDKLEKVAAKIEKLLKSQWEGRLKESSLQSSVKMPTKLESVTQWKSEQQQRTSSQRRTKNIIRKARLQLKKKNLNLRTRKSDKDTSVSHDSLKNNEATKSEPGLPEKEANTKLPIVDAPIDVPSMNLSSSPVVNTVDTAFKCIVCGFSKISAHNDGFSCGACSRFFDSFAKTPKQYFCTKDGNCIIDGVKDSASRKLVNARCKACWLKLCMEKFPVSSTLRDQLIKYVPRLDAPPHNPLLIVENIEPTEPIEEGIVRGPRIKHVCRRAAVVLGLPRATFPEPSESKESFNLSALPQEEKQKILETVPVEEKVISADPVASTSEIKPLPTTSKASKQQVKKKSHKDFKVKNRVHLDLLKKSSLLIHKEQKRRKLLMKKSMKHMHKHSFKKSLKVGRKSEMKKTLKFSYKSAVKTSLKTSPKIVSTRPLRTRKFRKVRCKQCEGCLAEDCGECAYCLDKKKFGGPNLIKQACKYRRCLRPIIPASEKASKLSQHENDKGKPSGGHSSFGGDGPSGIGLSLSSSSSSPTSPDGSSCGSSCSSSSSTSSSGSSGSSSSSSSSRSSTSTSSSSSSSDNISVPHTNMLPDSCANVSFMQNIISEPVILQESECTDNNVVTNPIFQEQGFNGEHYMISHSLQELVSNSLPSPQQKLLYSNQLLEGPMYKETGDTIFYEDSSSIIELKNASYAPSLYYGATHGDNDETVSYSSYTGSKNQNSRQSNSDSRRSHYSKDQDQYGSAGSGGQESNGDDDDDDDDEDNKRRKKYIYADYWEDYDFERISSQGFALISSQQIPLPCVCYLCGSAGEEKLIFCVLCCEPYHTFCLPEDDVPHEENLENWCCKRCQCCAVCGLKQNLLKCRKCQCTYHAECLTPHYPTKPSRKKRIWMCPKCVKCKSCGTTSPASTSGVLWNFDLLLCQPCAKLTDKGNYCPVCHKCYEENDYESKMVQCYKCNRWVHATCDNITDESYEILSCLPETVVYTCIDCTVETIPLWKKAIREYLKHGLKSVLNSLLTARCARHLIRQETDSSSSYLPAPSSESDSQLGNDKTDSENHLLHAQTDLQSDKSLSLNSEENCDRFAVAETVSSLVHSVHLHSFDEKNSDNTKNISSKEICDVENNTLQSSTKDTSNPNNKDVEKLPNLDLLVVKDNLDRGKYKTIASFFDDVIEIIECGNDMGMKHHTSATKAILIKQTEKIFPWFKVPSARIWKSKCDLPEGMLPNAVLPPHRDHIYAQYLERVIVFPPLNLKYASPFPDTRTCVLCNYSGDSQPKKCGRLLYCGQDEWIHVNCAIWSAEVFQQQDGSLRNVHPAISRGRLMHCEFCNQLGATVGCCVRGCPANYHFYCARKDEAILQADKKVFCALHRESVDEKILSEKDFPVEERVYVNQASIPPKWVKKSWEAPMNKDSLHIVIGSLTVNKLGRLTKLSHNKNVLIPVGYEYQKFWGTKNPNYVNVQHISVQSSFSANTVNQLVFPQQAVSFPQGQVMFVEDPVTHHLSPAQPPSNYVFQVPIEQTQNCAFTTYVPQQEIQPQFLNQFTFQSNTQQISNQQMNNVFQLQNPVPFAVGNLPQPTEIQRTVDNRSVNIITNSHDQLIENSAAKVQLAAKKTSQVIQSTVSPSPPSLSSRSSPASDISNNSKNCVSAITVPPNSNIVDILKKAAEQMLNIKANLTKKENSKSEVPEKKTRFAHTRKVAARKAEKLKQKNAVLNGSNSSVTSQVKPKSVKLNIIKPTFSIPFVPIPAPTKAVNTPSPKSEEVKTAESAKPLPLPEKKENTLPAPQLEVPTTLESNSDIYCYDDDDESEEESPLVRMHLRQMELEGREESFPKDRPYLMYEIDSEDGLHIQSRNLRDAWLKVYDELQDARIAAHMKQITLAPEDVNGPHMLGLDNPALVYLLEQLPGAECCPDYEFLFHQPSKEIFEIPENATGCARSEGFQGRKDSDMFNFLASEHRNRPLFLPPEEEEEGAQKSSRRTNLDLPIAMRFRFLKDVARETVGVYRSSIHGRGLFCKRNIDPGELVIEYAGEVIRSVLTDKRERIYQSKGIGCYMFRIDDDEVVDATMHGNAARFINHSCEPNCFSKVITIDGKKHIVIFALRRIIKGEELTYDYKFPFEDEKIPCHCNSRRCRKYLN